jgi:hypothetical protein
MKFQGLIYAELRSLTDRGGLKGCPVSHVIMELDEDALGSEGLSIPVFSMVLYILFIKILIGNLFLSSCKILSHHVILHNSPEFEISLIQAYHRPLIIFSATQHQHMLNRSYLSSSCLEEVYRSIGGLPYLIIGYGSAHPTFGLSQASPAY